MQPVKSGSSIPEVCYTESQGYQVAVCPPTLSPGTCLTALSRNGSLLCSLLMFSDTCRTGW